MIFIIPIVLVLLIGLFLPTTPRGSKSFLMSSEYKNSLLQNTPSPRIIFVGGSNISFGLNSQLIKESLQLNPINTAINEYIGIKFMIDNTLDYLQDGDIVVLIPEYSHYYKNLSSGSEELMRTIFDVNIKNIKYLNISQIIGILPHIPKYSMTKFKFDEYLNIEESDIYSNTSFNKFGDTYTHWEIKKQDFTPYGEINGEFNHKVTKYFEEFNLIVKNMGGLVLVSFPCYQDRSYNNSKNQILKVEQELLNSNLTVIGSTKRYKMPDSLIFNNPYHLNKNGVDYRTKMLIQDIKKALKFNSLHKN
jgi:hypothetical protein